MSTRNTLSAALLGLGAGIAYVLVFRPRHLRWGATEEEATETLPGDSLVPHPKSQATHGITIHAPVAEVWPWLVQIGQNKGGFYSYTWLENLVGCQMRNTDRIVPEFQPLHVGDKVWLHPKVPPLPVLILEPNRTLVFGSNTGEAGVWGFHLTKIDAHTTRLVVRGRGELNPGLLRWLINYVLFEPAHFIMEQKMMRTVKARAEAAAGGHGEILTEAH